jgi:hypothetical protein
LDVGSIEPDPVADLDVRRRGASAVVVPLVLLLCFYEGGLRLRDPGSDPVVKFVNRLYFRTRPVRLEPHPGEPAGVRHERNLLRRRVDVVVVCEFGGRKELIPVILLVVSEKPDELFHLLVDAFGLAVGLRW